MANACLATLSLILAVGAPACAFASGSTDLGSPDLDAASALDAMVGGDSPNHNYATDAASPLDASAPMLSMDAAAADTSTPRDSGTMDSPVANCPSAGYRGALAMFDLSGMPGDEPSAPAKSSAAG